MLSGSVRTPSNRDWQTSGRGACGFRCKAAGQPGSPGQPPLYGLPEKSPVHPVAPTPIQKLRELRSGAKWVRVRLFSLMTSSGRYRSCAAVLWSVRVYSVYKRKCPVDSGSGANIGAEGDHGWSQSGKDSQPILLVSPEFLQQFQGNGLVAVIELGDVQGVEGFPDFRRRQTARSSLSVVHEPQISFGSRELLLFCLLQG